MYLEREVVADTHVRMGHEQRRWYEETRREVMRVLPDGAKVAVVCWTGSTNGYASGWEPLLTPGSIANSARCPCHRRGLYPTSPTSTLALSRRWRLGSGP